MNRSQPSILRDDLGGKMETFGYRFDEILTIGLCFLGIDTGVDTEIYRFGKMAI
jgi:hypothetical protein